MSLAHRLPWFLVLLLVGCAGGEVVSTPTPEPTRSTPTETPTETKEATATPTATSDHEADFLAMCDITDDILELEELRGPLPTGDHPGFYTPEQTQEAAVQMVELSATVIASLEALESEDFDPVVETGTHYAELVNLLAEDLAEGDVTGESVEVGIAITTAYRAYQDSLLDIPSPDRHVCPMPTAPPEGYVTPPPVSLPTTTP